MRSSLKRFPTPIVAVMMLGACAHAENYRWSEDSSPKFAGNLSPPDGSSFGSWSDPSVSVYSFASPATPTPDASLRDLSDRGQAALILAMTASGAKPDDIRDALAKPLKAKTAPTETPVVTEGVFKRTLVANVTKGWNARPGDRLVWTWVYVKPLNFAFEGYTIVATDNQVLNIENVTNATTASLTGQLGRTTSGTTGSTTTAPPVVSTLSNVLGGSAGVSGSVGNTYTTTAAINQQYVKLGADIVPGELRIYRESERNLDVAGNTLIALSLRMDPNNYQDADFVQTLRVTGLNVLDDKRAFRSADETVIDVSVNKAPPRCELKAEVTLFYQFRRAKDGRSYVEGQQDAEYYSAQTTTKAVTVVPAGDITKPSWRIFSSASTVPLYGLTVFDDSLPIDFVSYEQANAFAAWLNHQPKSFFSTATPSIGKMGLKLISGIGMKGNWTPIVAGQFIARPFSQPPADLAKTCLKIDQSYAATAAAVAASQPRPQPTPVPPKRK
ncbi:hypothetical protein ACM61V_06065 [Sphingomonas sp. TX0543]|uniref:hypothetical protein n=1 Tax=unclassified Sphingomonas TaxID=196159 RepID=UPI0010F51846|nr:hypothetical protein [Sphingomonas sp. 3P27F8]